MIELKSPNGARGIRIIGNNGVELEIFRNKSGTSSFEIKRYDEEGDGSCFGIQLTKKETRAVVELLETKLHALKRPKELFNKDTAR